MGKMLDWVKANVKEGANIAEFEEMETKEAIYSIKDKDAALALLTEKGTVFNAAKDAVVNDAILSHDRKFNEEKLPKLIEAEREKIKNELNPPETETDKELRELKNWKSEQEAKNLRNEQKTALEIKAKEIGYPIELAGRFAVYGENAEAELIKDHESRTSYIKQETENEVKRLYGDIKPPKQSNGDPAKQMGRAEFDNLSPTEKGSFVANGGNVID